VRESGQVFDFGQLRRWPDVEAENLHATDASDRLVLDQAADALAAAGPGEVVVLEDHYGALTLGAAALHGARGIRVNQDALSGERALAANAAEAGLTGAYRSLDLGPELFTGARVVLLQLPRSLAALDELAARIARFASPAVQVFAGGRIKHMTTAMNEVLGRHFADLHATHARQKSRVLVASRPRVAPPDDTATDAGWPRRQFHEDIGLWVCAHGAAFAGTSLDIGTRYLLEFLDRMKPDAASAVDLGCGTGVLATALATRRPGILVIASDQSAAAVASARATQAANGVADRVSVVRDDALSARPDASTGLVLLNPPFHIGSSVHAGIALKLFSDAARVLEPGGELWTVWNTHLGYRPALTRIVGPTRQVGRNSKFTVTVSTRR
jgi:16S rRNA (guanine1207-N2)-methyltransferase